MVKYLPAERRKKILSYIQTKDFASINEICDYFNISFATVHRDLWELENQRLIQKIRGGATSIDKRIIGKTFLDRINQYPAQKQHICEYAIRFIKDHSTILLDNSTTLLPMLSHLSRIANLSVVTYFDEAIRELSNLNIDVNVISTGGQLEKEHRMFVGPITERTLTTIKVQSAFISCEAVNYKFGMMILNEGECRRKQLIIEAAEETNLLVDHSKFDKTSINIIAPLNKVRRIITSKGVDPEIATEIRKSGIELHIVD